MLTTLFDETWYAFGPNFTTVEVTIREFIAAAVTV